MIIARARFPLWLSAACALLAALVLWSFGVGRFPIATRDVWAALWSAIAGGDSGLGRSPWSLAARERWWLGGAATGMAESSARV